jgi:hypothetical protein
MSNMSDELTDLFKKALYAFKEVDDYENLHGQEDDYEEFKPEITYDYYIKKFFNIIDNGDNILGGPPSEDLIKQYTLYAIDYDDVEYHDFLWESFWESYNNIKKDNYSKFTILLESYEYMNFCTYVKKELLKLKKGQPFTLEHKKIIVGELKLNYKLEQQSTIEEEDYMIAGNSVAQGPKCSDCGSTYTEYMSDGVWHCGNCDEFFEPEAW